MKFKMLFLIAMLLLAACETTNMYPTKVVEVQVVKKETPAPVVVTETVTKIDCASIDPSFEQVGDTCVSICVACLNGGGQCLDTNNNGYGDTCVTPIKMPEVPFCMDYDNDNYVVCDVGCQVATNQQCGDCDNFNALVHPGADEVCDAFDNDCDGQTDEGFPVSGYYPDADGDGHAAIPLSGVPYPTPKWSCLPIPGMATASDDCNDTNPDIHPGVEEVCADNLDNDCDGVVDNGCAPSVVDQDNDGIDAKVDCDDNDPSINIEFTGCVDFKNSGEHKVVFVNKYINPGVTGIDYKEVITPGDADAKLTDQTPYTGNASTIEIPLKGGSWLHFNVYASMNNTYSYEFDSAQCVFKTLKLPPVYEFHDGKVKNRFSQIQVGKWDGGECYLTIPLAKIDP